MARIDLRLVLGGLAAAVFAGCSGGGTAFGPREASSTPSPAWVRFLNGAPGSPSVSVTIPAGAPVPNVAYMTVMPARFEPILSDQATAFTVKDDRTDTNIICKFPYNLLPGGYYTVVVAGVLTPPGGQPGNQQLQCEVFNEVYAPVDITKIQLIAHYAAPAFFAAIGTSPLQVGHYDPAQQPSSNTTPGAAIKSLGNPDVTATFETQFVGPFPTTSAASQSAVFSALSDGKLGIYVAHNDKLDAVTLPQDALIGAGNAGATPNMQNLFPIAGTTTYSVYAIDGKAGSPPLVLLGVVD